MCSATGCPIADCLAYPLTDRRKFAILQCATPNEAAKLQGPSLYRIMARRAAAVSGFTCSDAMRDRGAAGLVWDAATQRDIADPQSVVGTTVKRNTSVAYAA
jgi:cytochrome c2